MLVAGQAHVAEKRTLLSELKSTNEEKEKLENKLQVVQMENERLEEQVKKVEFEAVKFIEQKDKAEKRMATLKEEKKQENERLEEQLKKLETEAVKLKADNEELQKVGQKLIEQKDKAEKRMAMLEEERNQVEEGNLEEENLKEESARKSRETLELQKAKDKTTQSNLQIEVQVENLDIASKRAEGAATSEEKEENGDNSNLQNPRQRKRRASERREDLLISQQKQHKMSLKIVESGLSQLIEDEDTPMTMLGSLKALKDCTRFLAEDKDLQPQRKRNKLLKIKKEPKQEYFECNNETKSEPVDHIQSAE